ncbi:hypothetical protein LCGC14_0143020 [marine sediment metagenome]|uniref:Uncharacterized protein n=1 Tax=marine sediment metagenome TaxID=412755 RepID=A0A0F9XIL8_9ZZZZ
MRIVWGIRKAIATIILLLVAIGLITIMILEMEVLSTLGVFVGVALFMWAISEIVEFFNPD